MERTTVSSSNVSSIGYDSDSETLEVEFVRGGIYQYFDVPENVFNELINASSVGSYLNQNVKNSIQYSQI